MKLTCLRAHSLWVVTMGFETRFDYKVNIFPSILCRSPPHLLNFLTYRKVDSTIQWIAIYLPPRWYNEHFVVFVLSSICSSVHPSILLIFVAFKVSCRHHQYTSPLNSSAYNHWLELRICLWFFFFFWSKFFTEKYRNSKYIFSSFDKHIYLCNPNPCQDLKHDHCARK